MTTTKNKHAVALAHARSKSLSPERRKEIAALAAKRRWEAKTVDERAATMQTVRGFKKDAENLSDVTD